MKAVGNIWDNVCTQLDKICNKGLVVFTHFYVEILHISLSHLPRKNTKHCRLHYIKSKDSLLFFLFYVSEINLIFSAFGRFVRNHFFTSFDQLWQCVLHLDIFCPSVSAGHCRTWRTPRSPHVTRGTSTIAAPLVTSPPPVIQDPVVAAPGPSSLDMMGTGPQQCYFF